MSLGSSGSVGNLSTRNLKHLAHMADETALQAHVEVQKYSKLSSSDDELPDWAARHIEAHKKLETAVNAMIGKGNEDKIPKKVIASLKKSQKVVRELAQKVNHSAYMKAIFPPPETKVPGSTGLLVPLKQGESPSHSNMREWELNFGLLYSAYQRTDNEETKASIRFLMINYLAKAAYLNSNSEVLLSEEDMESYANMLQLGQLTLGGLYHRGVDVTNPVMEILQLTDMVGSPREGPKHFVPLETMEVQDLYSVGFVPTPDLSQPDEIVDILVQQFEANMGKFPDTNFEFPVLIDITPQIGQSLITENKKGKIAKYEKKQKAAKAQINEIIKRAAEEIKKRYPDRLDIQEKAQDYMKTNTAVVSRAQINSRVAVLATYPNLFDASDFDKKAASVAEVPPHDERRFQLQDKIKAWGSHTAIGLGAVSFRYALADLCKDPEQMAQYGGGRAVDYAVPGKPAPMMYKHPDTLLGTNIFRMLDQVAHGRLGTDHTIGRGQTLLAKATTGMLTTLLNKIPKRKWARLQKDPAIKEITQTAVLRLSQHLTTAVNHVNDFRKFSQAIDRAHAEMTTLLALYAPFDSTTFDAKYEQFLLPMFPAGMRPQTVGVAKSAMNIFSGVNAAVIRNNPTPVRICGAHSYYEEVDVVGGTRTLDSTLGDPSVDKVDLYIAEFYHNIDIDPDHTNYQKGTVIQDIRRIFTEKPHTDNLTVAIDATIDFTRSEDMQALLKEFEQEIKDGRLNIVVFRSGQKFDMLGLDNYFGAPFYIVNNGDVKWAEFNKIKTEQVHQIDDLSAQFFSLMLETGPEIVDQYKAAIFANTRAILDMVPPSLYPRGGKEVCVCTVEDGVKSPFIDIKFDLDDIGDTDEVRRWAQARFMELFTREEKLVYRRGSFGFAHPNITWIEPKMRINPGIDPDDNRLYQQFFRELADKVTEVTRQREDV